MKPARVVDIEFSKAKRLVHRSAFGTGPSTSATTAVPSAALRPCPRGDKHDLMRLIKVNLEAWFNVAVFD